MCSFQLTHPWGCDPHKGHVKNHGRFQLTHPWGCDAEKIKAHILSFISTHTPVRVWQYNPRIMDKNANFNSHTREVTSWWIYSENMSAISTHTPVRVWRQASADREQLRHNFNSHTREGVTARKCVPCSCGVFQLTHPWGCDTCQMYLAMYDDISTHTPVRVWRGDNDTWLQI